MSKDSGEFVKDTSYTQNRELSWLKFNERVLQEAADENVPAMERLKFISIFTSNLDEFFMVRVGSLFDMSQISPDERDNKTGMTPSQQLKKIYETIPTLIEEKDRIYAQVSEILKSYGIFDLEINQLEAEEKKHVNEYFKNYILPILSPQIIDPSHPFPHIVNKALYIAAVLKDKKDKASLGIIPVPSSLPPFVSMPESKLRFVRTENIVLANCENLFGSYTVESAGIICVTRNADISFDEEKFDDEESDSRQKMSILIKKRARLCPVRLEIQMTDSETLAKLLCKRLNLDETQVYFPKSPLNMKYVFDIEKKLPESFSGDLRYIPYSPVWPSDLDEKKSIMKQAEEKDRLLFYPYDKMEPFLKLLREAAENKDVLSIKMTIYRIASASKVAQELCRAAENGKDVTVLMELRARFDEANNIAWAERLEQAGCRVIYGIENFKCHSKICLITKKDKKGISYITQIGTGNYNEKTAAMYTDLSLITASNEIGRDATAFFQNMLVSNLNGSYSSLMVAPVGLKRGLMKLIDEEIKKGSAGRITIKANSLTERDVIDKLSQASKAGVKVQLILRGICCLRPGIEGKTDNIFVTSIVGRYLEHSRIYCFGQGENSRIYISSADLMTRNITRRVEIACPVYDREIRQTLMEMLDVMLKDDVKARALQSDGTYEKKQSVSGEHIDSQAYFMQNTIHKAQTNDSGVPDEKESIIEKIKNIFAGIIKNAD